MDELLNGVDFKKVLDTQVLENPLSLWLTAGVVALALVVVLIAVRWVLGKKLNNYGPGETFSWRHLTRDLVHRTNFFFLVIAGLYLASRLLDLPEHVEKIVTPVFVVAFFVQAAVWADRVMDAVMKWQVGRRASGSVRNALSLIQFIASVGVWSIALLLILSNLGFDITALVAGLGIGGIAVALAAQNVLGDLFASLAIVLDKPFEVGDFIIFGDQYMGTVEKIGIKTTRLRSLSGEQLVCANNDLLGSRIRNYKRMQERRIVFSVGVTYETPRDKLVGIADMLREIVEEHSDSTRLDRAHLKEFGDSAIVFEVVHWMLKADYNFYMDVQQSINLKIFDRFAAEGIDFAYPTQTIHMYQPAQKTAKANGPAAARTATA